MPALYYSPRLAQRFLSVLHYSTGLPGISLCQFLLCHEFAWHFCQPGFIATFPVHGFTWYFCQPPLFQRFFASLHCSWIYQGIFSSLHCSKGLPWTFASHHCTKDLPGSFPASIISRVYWALLLHYSVGFQQDLLRTFLYLRIYLALFLLPPPSLAFKFSPMSNIYMLPFLRLVDCC